jgi:integrase
MWIEKRGRQHRVYYRTRATTGPKKAFEPFGTREQAEAFIKLAQASNLPGALAYVRDPRPDALLALLGRVPIASGDPSTSTATLAVTGTGVPPADAMDRFSPAVGVTFDRVWEAFLKAQRHLEETTADTYEGYGKNHFLPFFGGHDIGLIQQARPLNERHAVPGAIYVDDWVSMMLKKERKNNAGRPIKGKLLAIKFIKNVFTVLKQTFDFALSQRPVLIQANPASGISLPKQDRREMFFLEDGATYDLLRAVMHEHFRPVLDFLVGTGARFGEAAGLLVRHVHLDVERPYLEIRLVLKWARKRWKLGRPKTKSSVRRISLSPKLVAVLRPLLAEKTGDDHVFTMVEGGPMHHGNFTNRYFKKAVLAAGGKVPKRLRIHDLRHTHAAWLLSDNVAVFVVQRRLGHSNSSTTQDIYGHLTPEADEHTLELVDRRLPDVLCRDDEGATVIKLTKQEAALPEFEVDDEDDLAA